MVRVCVSFIALTCVFFCEAGEFKSLMDPLHHFKVYLEKLSNGGVD